jgi:hypothetical protein
VRLQQQRRDTAKKAHPGKAESRELSPVTPTRTAAHGLKQNHRRCSELHQQPTYVTGSAQLRQRDQDYQYTALCKILGISHAM